MRPISETKIFVAGSTGMVGRAIVRALEREGCPSILQTTSAELDLRDQSAVRRFFAQEKPELVILGAARVGGIAANDSFRADFIYDNLMIEANVVEAAFSHATEKLIFLGSSCIYPRLSSQPIVEEELLTGPLEPTNEPYAIAKIAGVKLCESFYRQHGVNFYSVMPTNLYGPHDNFDLSTSHVVPALIRKFHEAKANNLAEVTVWGSGTPRREFLNVDDLAAAVVLLAERVDACEVYGLGTSHVNIGFGTDITIAELATLVAEVTGFAGRISFDQTKPDGTPRKLLDTTRMNNFGWIPSISLASGLALAYRWYTENVGGDRL